MANPIIKKPGFDLDTYENLGDTESPTNRSWEVQTPTAQWKLESTSSSDFEYEYQTISHITFEYPLHTFKGTLKNIHSAD